MTKEIKICMGSACFARGSDIYSEKIDAFIKENNLDAKIEFYGEHCREACEKGPNLYVDGKCINNLDDEKLNKLLEELKS